MKWRECFEELLIAIDVAGSLQMDNMYFVANPQSFAPDGAKSIEEMGVGFGCNVDQLGKSTGFMILEGSAFPDGPHHIPLGSAGGELIDGGHAIRKSTQLGDLGIRVKGGGQYTCTGRIVGDTVDEAVLVAELIFSDKAPRRPKHWVAAAIETAVVNTPAQTENIDNVAEAVSSDGSTLIDGILKTGAMDFAALGSHAGIITLSGGVTPRQEILTSAGGGELVIGGGDLCAVAQEFDCQIPCDKKKLIQVMSVGVGEAGTIMNAISLGFAV